MTHVVDFGDEAGANVPWFASSEDLCSYFGSAVGMYFWTAQQICLVFLLIFLVQLPSIWYLGFERDSGPPLLNLSWLPEVTLANYRLFGSASCRCASLTAL
jgi:hypothetical protein